MQFRTRGQEFSNYTSPYQQQDSFKISLELPEKILAVLGLLFFSGVFHKLAPNALQTLIRYIVWLIPTALLCLRWKNTLLTMAKDKFLWLLVGLLFISFLWSDFYQYTLADNREVLQMTTFGLYLATRFTLKQQVRFVALALGIGAILSILVAFVIPEIGIHGADHPGAWKGVYGYKNNLGSMMVLNAVTFFLLPVKQQFYRYAGLGLAIALIFLSTSKTSLTITFILFFTLFLYRKFRWKGKVTVLLLDLGILLGGCISTIIFSYWVEILAGLGRDPTLTGRTPMWGVALVRLMDRPLFGYGRTAFWAPGSEYAQEAGQAVATGFVPPHAHNGLIDLALDVGLVGLALFLITFIRTYIRSLKIAYATTNIENLWPLVFLMFLFLNNITESYLLYKSNMYWVLFVSTVLTI
ncbi:MAG: O-antigen ligase family protein [Cyanobacteria bacterium P01_A01_bin.84]